MDALELTTGLRQVFQESRYMSYLELGNAAARLCYPEKYRINAESLVELYLQLLDRSVNGGQHNLATSGRAVLMRKRRQINKPNCNFTSTDFTWNLFEMSFQLAKTKIESGIIQPVPQIGPLIMEVRGQRAKILADANLDLSSRYPDSLYENRTLFREALGHTDDETRSILSEALNDLHVRAVKRLIVAANVKPEELSQLNCVISELDLYAIFPLPVIGEMYDRKHFEEVGNYSLVSLYDDSVMNETVSDNAAVSVLLPILHFGASAMSAHGISKSELQVGQQLVFDLYQRAMTIYEAAKIGSDRFCIVARAEYKLASEQRRYFGRLKSVFHLGRVSDSDVTNLVKGKLTIWLAKKAHIMETLSFQYRVVKALLDILFVSADQLGTDLLDNAPMDVLADLYPDYALGLTSFGPSYQSTMTPKISEKIENGVKNNNTTGLERSMQRNKSSPYKILACSLEALPETEECSLQSPQSYDQQLSDLLAALSPPNGGHRWFRAWMQQSDDGSLLKDQAEAELSKALIEVLYLKVMHLVDSKSQAGLMSTDDDITVKMFLGQQKRVLSAMVKGNASENALEDSSLRLLLSTAKKLILQLRLKPPDLDIPKNGTSNAVVEHLFQFYLERQGGPASKMTVCNFEKGECDSVGTAASAVTDDSMDVCTTEMYDSKKHRNACVSQLYDHAIKRLFQQGRAKELNRTTVHLMQAIDHLAKLNTQTTTPVSAKDSKSDNTELIFSASELQEISADLTGHKLMVIKAIVETLKLKPEDLGYDFHMASNDKDLRTVFIWHFTSMSQEQKRLLLLVDALFKQAKALLQSLALTKQQLKQVTKLQGRVNEDSVTVAEKYLKINATGKEKQVSKILADMVASGHLTQVVIDEVNEFALLQKVYIIMRLVRILDLKRSQFDAKLISQIPFTYVSIMFKPDDSEKTNWVTGRRRREASERNATLSLSTGGLLNIAFYLYHRAVALASYKQGRGELKEDVVKALEAILDNQQASIMQSLHGRGGRGSLESTPNNGSYVLLTARSFIGLDQTAVSILILKHQLKVTKQIILLLDLTADDFQLLGNFQLPQGISRYLFGEAPELTEEANAYFNSANTIYAEIRNFLSVIALGDRLTPRQIIIARTIIHDLNEGCVTAMVNILDLRGLSENPDKLIGVIKDKMSDPKSEYAKVQKIQTFIYERKVKAIKQFVLLLNLNATDIRLPIGMPDDLKTYLFTNGDVASLSQVRSGRRGSEGADNNIFCLPCFHRLYTRWMKENNIHSSVVPTNQAPQKRTFQDDDDVYLNAKVINETLDFLNDPARDLQQRESAASAATANAAAIARDHFGLDLSKLPREARRRNAGLILHLYQECLRLKDSKSQQLTQETKLELQKILSVQKEDVFKRLPAVLGNSSVANSSPLGVAVEVQDSGKKVDFEIFGAEFHLYMIKTFVKILKLKRNDFREVNIPGEIAEVIFPSTVDLLTVDKVANLAEVYNVVIREYTKAVLLGQVAEKDTVAIDFMITALQEREAARIKSVLGDSKENLAVSVGELRDRLRKKIRAGEVPEIEMGKLRRESFDDTLSATKSMVQLLDLDIKVVPGYNKMDHTVLTNIFGGSIADTEEAFLEQKESVGKNNNSNHIGLTAKGRNILGDISEFASDSQDGRPVGGVSGGDVDLRQYVVYKRSINEGFQCKLLRQSGLRVVPLSGQTLAEMSETEVLNCADIIQATANSKKWEQLLQPAVNLSLVEFINIMEKNPSLSYTQKTTMSQLTFLGNNFQAESPPLCRDFHGHLSSFLRGLFAARNETISTENFLALVRLPCFLFNIPLRSLMSPVAEWPSLLVPVAMLKQEDMVKDADLRTLRENLRLFGESVNDGWTVEDWSQLMLPGFTHGDK